MPSIPHSNLLMSSLYWQAIHTQLFQKNKRQFHLQVNLRETLTDQGKHLPDAVHIFAISSHFNSSLYPYLYLPPIQLSHAITLVLFSVKKEL